MYKNFEWSGKDWNCPLHFESKTHGDLSLGTFESWADGEGVSEWYVTNCFRDL